MKNNQIQKLIKALHLFQELDPEMTIPQMLTFLNLSEWDLNKPPSVTELGKTMGLENFTTAGSRNIMAWCDLNRNKLQGFDFMETKENPAYRVQKNVYMKHGGYVFLEKLLKILNEEC
jgi:hypothetical protein